MTDPEDAGQKPSLRGVLHQWAAVYALGAGTGLVALAPTAPARIATGIYAASLVLLFAVSAVYHRFHWTPGVRTWLRRADHASIFLLIGGSYTPIAVLALDAATGKELLILTGHASPVMSAAFSPDGARAVTCCADGTARSNSQSVA